jgi:hypothetical protein
MFNQVLSASAGAGHIPQANIAVSGIPIDPAFSQPRDQLQMRLAHGL